MIKSLLIFSLAAIAYAAPDGKQITTHIRESFGYPPDVSLSIDAPQPSELEGFQAANLKIEYNGGEQSQKVYISEDGKHYFLGIVKDLSTKPDEERWSKISLDKSPSKGGKNAKVIVAEFSDFQCPACRGAYHNITKNLVKDYGDQLRLVFKHLPLINIHPWAESAAVAAECARLQGEDKFWPMHDAYFEQQSTVTVQNVREKSIEFAKAAKADTKRFAACYDKKETLSRVNADVAEADAVGLGSTPTFLVNGHALPGGNYKTLRAIIDEFLSGTHAKP